jgi:hypothetical protein
MVPYKASYASIDFDFKYYPNCHCSPEASYVNPKSFTSVYNYGFSNGYCKALARYTKSVPMCKAYDVLSKDELDAIREGGNYDDYQSR